MSQIHEYSDVKSINEVPLVQEVKSHMVDLAEMSEYSPMNITLPELHGYCPQNMLSAIQSTQEKVINSQGNSICSPNTLRALFGNTYNVTLGAMQAKGLTGMEAKKASLVVTLSKLDFRVSDKNRVVENLKSVMGARDEKTLRNQMKVVMTDLEADHTQLFVKRIANACAVASANVGFKHVTVKVVSGNLEVIAVNPEGRKLISEIAIDQKTHQVNCSTETIGIVDGSCTKIIQQHSDELKKMGIRIGVEKTTFTGDVCRLPYAKILDQADKAAEKKRRAQERTRRLNAVQKIKS